jgi:hypothetical protein
MNSYTPINKLPMPPQWMLDELEEEITKYNTFLMSQIFTIREARPIRNAIRQKLHVHPTANALHNEKCKSILDKKPLMPKSYNKFFTKNDGSIKSRTKKNVEKIIKRFEEIKYAGPRITQEMNKGHQFVIYWYRYSKDDGFDVSIRRIIPAENGIYGLLEYMSKNKLFNKSPIFDWVFGV